MNIGAPNIWSQLRAHLSSPRLQVRSLAFEAESEGAWPYFVWSMLCVLALIGTAFYALSLSWAFPVGSVLQWVMVLTLSTGISWCVLLPLLVLITQKRWGVCVHVCLVTMAFGEAVLISGGLLNLGACLGVYPALYSLPLNLGVLLASNIMMATVFFIQFRALGASVGEALALWMLGLNVPGALLFLFFHELIFQVRVEVLVEVFHALLGQI